MTSCGTCKFWAQLKKFEWLGSCTVKLPPFVAQVEDHGTRHDACCDLHSPKAELQ